MVTESELWQPEKVWKLLLHYFPARTQAKLTIMQESKIPSRQICLCWTEDGFDRHKQVNNLLAFRFLFPWLATVCVILQFSVYNCLHSLVVLQAYLSLPPVCRFWISTESISSTIPWSVSKLQHRTLKYVYHFRVEVRLLFPSLASHVCCIQCKPR